MEYKKVSQCISKDYCQGWNDAVDEMYSNYEMRWCRDCKEYDKENHCCHRYSITIREAVKQVESNFKWHDLRKDPTDLPLKTGDYLVRINCENGEWYEVDDFTENKNFIHNDFGRQEDATNYVVGWKEIEPFEVEE